MLPEAPAYCHFLAHFGDLIRHIFGDLMKYLPWFRAISSAAKPIKNMRVHVDSHHAPPQSQRQQHTNEQPRGILATTQHWDLGHHPTLEH